MKLKKINEELTEDEVWDLEQRLLRFSEKYIKGSYRGQDYIGRRWGEILEFAEELKRNKRLFAEVRENYEQLVELLEWENAHSEVLGLEAIFEPKEFMKTVQSIFQHEIDRIARR